jgi:hypothetical protein
MRKLLTSTLLLCFAAHGLGQINAGELLERSKKFYDSITVFSVQVTECYKTAISLDTTLSRYTCFIDRSNDAAYFLSSSGNSGYFVKDGNEFSVEALQHSFQKVKKAERKNCVYYQKYSKLPFINFDHFLNELKAKDLSFLTTTSGFFLANDEFSFEFRLPDLAITKMLHTGMDRMTGGDFFELVSFNYSFDNSEIKESLDFAQQLVSDPTAVATKPKSENQIPTHFDLNNFNRSGLRWNNAIPGITGKKLVLDFFYQGCYPCVKSYPYLEALHNDSDSSYVVIGIDTKPSDTVYLTKYLERYRISYPVLSGLDAQKIAEDLEISTWPTMIILDEKGKIIIYQQGFTPAMFRKLLRKLK